MNADRGGDGEQQGDNQAQTAFHLHWDLLFRFSKTQYCIPPCLLKTLEPASEILRLLAVEAKS